MTEKKLEGKTAIVTGAASGIGRASALLFAEEGANIMVADVKETVKEGGEPTAEVIQKNGGSAAYRKTDVSVWEQVDTLVQEAIDRFGRLHIICNAVAPGRIIIRKPMSGVDSVELAEARTPIPRLGKPIDIAKAALYLAHGETTYITGVNLMVDGGWMAG